MTTAIKEKPIIFTGENVLKIMRGEKSPRRCVRGDGQTSPEYLLKRIANGVVEAEHGCFVWASRLTLEITDIRVQRVQEISEEDAKAEGVKPALPVADKRWVAGFARSWNSINGKGAWERNDWVWAITFQLANTH